MHVRYLLGRAGTGKTHRCLSEISESLAGRDDGPELIFVVPRQATFQIERQLLLHFGLSGYTRLHVVSFEKLAGFILQKLNQSPPNLLGEDGAAMVLRSILLKLGDQLRIFHASSRLNGFAVELQRCFTELKTRGITPTLLREISNKIEFNPTLASKLADLAMLDEAYTEWLNSHQLGDTLSVMSRAVEVLESRKTELSNGQFQFEGIWLDGFSTLTPVEMDLLAACGQFSKRLTLSFCIDPDHRNEPRWTSGWFETSATFNRVFGRFAALHTTPDTPEIIALQQNRGRFPSNSQIGRIERWWMQSFYSRSDSWLTDPNSDGGVSEVERNSVRLVQCEDLETEAAVAAREILEHVRMGGRYRDVGIVLRNLEVYHSTIRRVFQRYEIPFFLDRREPIAHHPLPEFLRFVTRCLAFGCQPEDWFGWLKTRLTVLHEDEVDQLELFAQAHGWTCEDWFCPVQGRSERVELTWVENKRREIVRNFSSFLDPLMGMDGKQTSSVRWNPIVSGGDLVKALKRLCMDSGVEHKLNQEGMGVVIDGNNIDSNIHRTVVKEVATWMEHFNRAFATERMRVSDWLPIMESGLAGLSAGIIPPVMDQVLVGVVDRTRNPELKRVILMGLNETFFPAPIPSGGLISDSDREIMEGYCNSDLGIRFRHISQERYLSYIALTRASERLTVTWSKRDGDGSELAPSSFLGNLRILLPEIPIESCDSRTLYQRFLHRNEMIAPVIIARGRGSEGHDQLASLPGLEDLPSLATDDSEQLDPLWIRLLWGCTILSSVSRLEDFGACPFKFFVRATMRVEELKKFELDSKERGTFQHDLLANFHLAVSKKKLKWRDLTPDRAIQMVRELADEMVTDYRDGMFTKSGENQFRFRVMTNSVAEFVGQMIEWMRCYQMDPIAVELGFGGGDDDLKEWKLDLGGGTWLALRGRVDRVDLSVEEGSSVGWISVIDYKSSYRAMDDLMLEHGLQMQLPAYLAALTKSTEAARKWEVRRLVPVGLFYANLKPNAAKFDSRLAAEGADGGSTAFAGAFHGRFRLDQLGMLDSDYITEPSGQFKYRLRKDGSPYASEKQLVEATRLEGLLGLVERALVRAGQGIFSGDVRVFPFRHGNKTACERCEYAGVCRIDPWTHQNYRTLSPSTCQV